MGIKTCCFPIRCHNCPKIIVVGRTSWNRLQTTYIPLSVLQSIPDQIMFLHCLWTFKNLYLWIDQHSRSITQALLFSPKQLVSHRIKNTINCHLRGQSFVNCKIGKQKGTNHWLKLRFYCHQVEQSLWNPQSCSCYQIHNQNLLGSNQISPIGQMFVKVGKRNL